MSSEKNMYQLGYIYIYYQDTAKSMKYSGARLIFYSGHTTLQYNFLNVFYFGFLFYKCKQVFDYGHYDRVEIHWFYRIAVIQSNTNDIWQHSSNLILLDCTQYFWYKHVSWFLIEVCMYCVLGVKKLNFVQKCIWCLTPKIFEIFKRNSLFVQNTFGNPQCPICALLHWKWQKTWISWMIQCLSRI